VCEYVCVGVWVCGCVGVTFLQLGVCACGVPAEFVLRTNLKTTRITETSLCFHQMESKGKQKKSRVNRVTFCLCYALLVCALHMFA